MFSIVVQKYGGSSVATPEKILSVARFIKTFVNEKKKICVVVSAMGKTTDNLLDLALKISNNPNKRELDMLISCGERISMSLLAMALTDLGLKSISLTGSQVGIITSKDHRNAHILEIRPKRLKEELLENDVVIVAGFQGVSLENEITTLRRGGSDTTAVALAKALNAESLEIYSDVPGILDADPNIVENAQKIDHILLEDMTDMALYGAKVLAYDACLMANEHNITIKSAKTLDKENITIASKTPISTNKNEVLSITHFLNIKEEESFDKNTLLIIKDKIYTASNKESLLGMITVHLQNNNFLLKKYLYIKNILKENNIKENFIIANNKQIYIILDSQLVKSTLGILHENLFSKR